jgi:methylenetetrahydrofolate dehydrogenase (NADP+)/methenyltetrahydrofolate cyclohydrolase
MIELKGKLIADKIKEEVSSKLEKAPSSYELAIIRIGDNNDQVTYENSAKKKLSEAGINVKSYVFDSNISNDQFYENFKQINSNENVKGILLLKPLPSNIDEIRIAETINPRKDLDGISPYNFYKACQGKEGNLPCTPVAVLEILKGYNIELKGKNAVIVNRSLVVGKSLAMLLLKEDCTVTICHSKTQNLEEITSKADIVIFAIGSPKKFDSTYIKEGAVVIVVSINQDENGKLRGDCDYESMITKASAITPVPGGVGVVTSMILGKHFVQNL